MRRRKERRIERFLAASNPSADRVRSAIEAVNAPVSAEELSREIDVLAMYRATAGSQLAAGRLRYHRSRPIGFGLKSLIASASLFAVGTGVAVAAAVGALPAPIQQPAHDIFNAPPATKPARPPASTQPRTTSSSTSESTAARSSIPSSTSSNRKPTGPPTRRGTPASPTDESGGTAPAKPAQTGKPRQSTHPTHPVHPTHPSKPTQGPKPPKVTPTPT